MTLASMEAELSVVSDDRWPGLAALLAATGDRSSIEAELRQIAADLAEAQRIAHLGNWRLDLRTGKITWSDELYRIWEIDKSRFDASYASFVEHVHPEDREKVLRTNTRARMDGAPFTIDYRIITPAHHVKVIREVGYVARDDAGTIVQLSGVAQDITDLTHVDEKLQQSERQLVEAQRLAHVGSWDWDLRSNTVTWSAELYRIFGVHPGDIDVLHEAMSFIHQDDRDVVLGIVERSLITKESYSMFYRVLRPDGDERIVHSRGHIVSDEHGTPVKVYGATQDLTELKRTENKLMATSAQLRALSARLRSAREEEGARIARELHDELGSALTSLRYDLDLLTKEASSTHEGGLSHFREKLAAMMQTIDQTVDTVRRISSELRPSVLDDVGLVAAIRWQATQFVAQSGLACECDCRLDDIDLEPQLSTAIFRVFQEALTNVRRHAHATSVTVTLRRDDQTLVLSISDDGRGITAAEQSDRPSLGLLGMRERIELLGGTIDITGVQGQGTVITVRIPIRAQPQ